MQYLQTFEAYVSVNTFNISVMKTTFSSNVCKYCMLNMNSAQLLFQCAMYSCFMKIDWI